MSVTALIVLTQNAVTAPAGRAFSGVTGLLVTITNNNNTSVTSWTITLVDVPPSSSLVPGVLGTANNNNPTATFTPDVPGSYRLMLDVVGGASTDRDIRNFGVPNARGYIVPSFQGTPAPLLTKPNEENYGGQTRGWAGTGSDGQLQQFLETYDDAIAKIVTSTPFTIPNTNNHGLYVVDLGATGNPATVNLPLSPRAGHKVRIGARGGSPTDHVFVHPPAGTSIFSLPSDATIWNDSSAVLYFLGLIGGTNYWDLQYDRPQIGVDWIHNTATKVSASFTTTGLADGDFGYVSSINTVSKTDADFLAKSYVVGANEGAVGTMITSGVVLNAKFTTAGGSPTVGLPVYLAPGSEDGAGAGLGKLTATAPTAAGKFLAPTGICLDDTNYASLKTAKILFHPKEVTRL